MAVIRDRARNGLRAKHGVAVVTRQGGQKIAAINMYRRNQNGGGRCRNPADCLYTHTHTPFSWRKVRELYYGNMKPDNSEIRIK
jgi:hypothetical protein